MFSWEISNIKPLPVIVEEAVLIRHFNPLRKTRPEPIAAPEAGAVSLLPSAGTVHRGGLLFLCRTPCGDHLGGNRWFGTAPQLEGKIVK